MINSFLRYCCLTALIVVPFGSSSAAVDAGHTLDFAERFQNDPWISEFNNIIINGQDVPPAKRKKAQQSLDKIEKLDKDCAAMEKDDARAACLQQRNALISNVKKKCGD